MPVVADRRWLLTRTLSPMTRGSPTMASHRVSVWTWLAGREATLTEVFGRLVFNVLIGNGDDHARNHAAFWDGCDLTLTPAYDLDPQPRDTGEATQAMAVTSAGDRRSRPATCVDAAGAFLLSQAQARAIIDRLVQVIVDEFDDAADMVGLTGLDRTLLWRRAFLHPSASEEYGPAPS